MQKTYLRMIVAAGILALTAFSRARAENSPIPPSDQGMIVLRNGEVIEGRISQIEGWYVADLSNGQIRIKTSDVDVVCHNLEEGYQRKRALIQVGNVQHHLELAQWCLRHDLLGPAAVELAEATVADPKNPAIGVLQHKLKKALEPPAQPSSPEMKSRSRPGPSNEELTKMVRGLPEKVIETFTQSIQPVLMNSCTGSGCHNSETGQGLRLVRIGAGRSPNHRITQRNLYSVLQYVDRENPGSSRLLLAPIGPHGTAQHAIFNEHQALQYRHLMEWVALVSQQPQLQSPATVAPAATEENAEVPSGKRNHPRKAPHDVRKDQPQPASDDPFDPEEFNRRNDASQAEK
jgi:hypothetical protein